MNAQATANTTETAKIPPRDRILAAATDLFYRHGIRAVGVDAIAEAAGTNKMTLYRHFDSKDALVAEYLTGLAAEAEKSWDALERQNPGNPRAQLSTWLKSMEEHVLSADERGCALVNAAVELPEKEHPARCVIERSKIAQRARLIALCRGAGADDAELLADAIFLLLEGARVSAQSVGPTGPASHLARMGEALIKAHSA